MEGSETAAEAKKVQTLGLPVLSLRARVATRGDRPPKVCPNPECKSPYWFRPEEGTQEVAHTGIVPGGRRCRQKSSRERWGACLVVLASLLVLVELW